MKGSSAAETGAPPPPVPRRQDRTCTYGTCARHPSAQLREPDGRRYGNRRRLGARGPCTTPAELDNVSCRGRGGPSPPKKEWGRDVPEKGALCQGLHQSVALKAGGCLTCAGRRAQGEPRSKSFSPPTTPTSELTRGYPPLDPPSGGLPAPARVPVHLPAPVRPCLRLCYRHGTPVPGTRLPDLGPIHVGYPQRCGLKTTNSHSTRPLLSDTGGGGGSKLAPRDFG